MPTPLPASAQRANRIAIACILGGSAVVVLFLFWLIYFHKPPPGTAVPEAASMLPAFNALCNSVAATCIAAGILFIRAGRKTAHGVSMAGAVIASALFLTGYLIYHSTHGHTVFGRTDWLRPVYLFILITHIILSVVVVPLVLSSVWFAIRRQWRLHRKISRWTYPVWLYVSVTGVVVFVMLRMLNEPL